QVSLCLFELLQSDANRAHGVKYVVILRSELQRAPREWLGLLCLAHIVGIDKGEIVQRRGMVRPDLADLLVQLYRFLILTIGLVHRANPEHQLGLSICIIAVSKFDGARQEIEGSA